MVVVEGHYISRGDTNGMGRIQGGAMMAIPSQEFCRVGVDGTAEPAAHGADAGVCALLLNVDVGDT